MFDCHVQGGMARFINHSCDPNCQPRIVTIDGEKHIAIYSKRRIVKGEELTYNYKVTRSTPMKDCCRPLCLYLPGMPASLHVCSPCV